MYSQSFFETAASILNHLSRLLDHLKGKPPKEQFVNLNPLFAPLVLGTETELSLWSPKAARFNSAEVSAVLLLVKSLYFLRAKDGKAASDVYNAHTRCSHYSKPLSSS